MKKAAIIKAKFLRGQSELSHTKSWDDLDENTQKNVLKFIILTIEERPVLLYQKGIDYWWLLTNRALYVYSEVGIREITFEDILNVKLNNLFDGNISKIECESIQILTINGIVDLLVEKKSWPTVYSILQFVT